MSNTRNMRSRGWLYALRTHRDRGPRRIWPAVTASAACMILLGCGAPQQPDQTAKATASALASAVGAAASGLASQVGARASELAAAASGARETVEAAASNVAATAQAARTRRV